MKKRLEAELISIAHRILKLKGKEDLFQLHLETQKLYEALSVLKFVEINENIIQPKIDRMAIEENIVDFILPNPLKQAVIETTFVEGKASKIIFDDMFLANYQEPVFEKIDSLKIEIENIEAEIETIEAEIETIEDDIVAIEKNNEKIERGNQAFIKNLNDKPSEGFSINLNDKIGFVQHLFDNNNEDFNRVLSQLSTLESLVDAKEFINTMVKPDYNDWNGKEDFEERFMVVVEQKFIKNV